MLAAIPTFSLGLALASLGPFSLSPTPVAGVSLPHHFLLNAVVVSVLALAADQRDSPPDVCGLNFVVDDL